MIVFDMLEDEYRDRKNLSEEDKDELLTNMKMAIDLARKELDKNEEKINEYEKRLTAPVLYNRADVEKIFKCKDAKALAILRDAIKKGYGVKIGKEFYIQANKFEEYMGTIG